MNKLLGDLEEVVDAVNDLRADLTRKNHAPMSDTELKLAHFIRTRHVEIAEALADARRYRWLRDHQFSFTHDQHERGIASTRWGEWVDTDDAASLDLCIDTVMREGSDHDRRIDAQHNSAREGE